MRRRVLSMLLALVMVLTLLPSTSQAESIGTSTTEEHVHDYGYGSARIFPSCTQIGYTIYECECGDSYKGNFAEALGHSYVNGNCERCGAADPDAENAVERPTTGSCGENVVWAFDETTWTLSISGEGPMADYEGEKPWQKFMQDIKALVVEPGVTTIGNSALSGAMRLERAELPEGITSIGTGAFDLTLNLTGITLPQSLSYIGELAFSNSRLARITVPANVKTLGPKAFWFCVSLKEIVFEGDAPELLEDSIFIAVKATAYYPEGNETWTEEIMSSFGGEISWIPYDCGRYSHDVVRLSGKTRYETAFSIANQLKENLNIEKFETVVVAYGQNFPDALTGSYLAAVKNAPILLTESSKDGEVIAYIQENLAAGGKVYILGGSAAVSEAFETMARELGYDVERVKGSNRYETNLEILKVAGVSTDQEILIATGTNYADSLSASATGLPMVLVGTALTDAQKQFLGATSGKFVILGGTAAVSEAVEAELAAIGSVERVKGKNRYETSVVIAQRYFENPDAVVLAYANGFPDGLCGGALAVSMHAPLILTSDGSPAAADAYVEGITTGVVTGGAARISDKTAAAIFDLVENAVIPKK